MIQFNQLRITTVKAQIDMRTVNPIMSEPYVLGDLNIAKNPAQLNMHTENIKCDIDSTACRAEEGLKSVEQLARDFAAESIENAKEATHRLAVQGQQLVHARKGEKVIIENAKQKVKARPPLSNIKFIPSTPPTITWHENHLTTDFEPCRQNFNWDVHSRANVEEVRKPELDITVTQKPEMHIEYVGDMFKKLDVKA